MEPRADGLRHLWCEARVKRRKEAGEGVKAVPSALPCFLAQAPYVGCHYSSHLGRNQHQGESALVLHLSWLELRLPQNFSSILLDFLVERERSCPEFIWCYQACKVTFTGLAAKFHFFIGLLALSAHANLPQPFHCCTFWAPTAQVLQDETMPFC